jgi:HTH-type transcriptional regulator / antitoxin HigA
MIISTEYIKLINEFPPRTITCEEDFIATQQVINHILDQNRKLTESERYYLNLLGTLVYEYEQTLETIPDIYGVELLKELIREWELEQKDIIFIFKTESIMTDILNGKVKMTVEHIEKLAELFHVSPSIFFPKKPVAKIQLV